MASPAPGSVRPLLSSNAAHSWFPSDIWVLSANSFHWHCPLCTEPAEIRAWPMHSRLSLSEHSLMGFLSLSLYVLCASAHHVYIQRTLPGVSSPSTMWVLQRELPSWKPHYALLYSWDYYSHTSFLLHFAINISLCHLFIKTSFH